MPEPTKPAVTTAQYTRIEVVIIRVAALLIVLVAAALNASVFGPLLTGALLDAAGRDAHGRIAAVCVNVLVGTLNLIAFMAALRMHRSVSRPRRGWGPQAHLMFVSMVIVAGGAAYVGEVTLNARAEAPVKATRFRCIRLKERPPFQDYESVPSDFVVSISDNLPIRPYRMRTDANGFILPGNHDPAAEFTIVFLGGSTTECAYVDEGERFPYLVGHRLAGATGRSIAAYNSGVSGNTAMHSVNLLINKALPLKPDVVVLMHNINDVITLLYTGSYWNDHPRRSMIETRTISPGNASRAKWTPIAFPRIAQWAAERIETVGRTAEVDEWAGYRSRLQLRPDFIAEEFAGAIRTFVAVCRAWGIEPVLMTQAGRMPPDPDSHVQQAWMEALQKGFDAEKAMYADFRALHMRLNEVVREIGREQEVRVIDLAAEIPADSEHMYDIVHLTAAGSRCAAKAITRELTPLVQSIKTH